MFEHIFSTSKPSKPAVCGLLTDGRYPEAIDMTADALPKYPGEELVMLLVASFMGTNRQSLMGRTRGRAEVCLARQVAMYLMHTSLSWPYYEIARYFRRDRTTVSYACKLVEDMRDDAGFDRKITKIEEIVKAALALASEHHDK